MTLPTPNSWAEFQALEPFLGAMGLLEKRMDNDSSGRILYIGYTQIANGATSEPIWMIRKFSYDGNNFINRDQLPDNGQGSFMPGMIAPHSFLDLVT